jgi:cytochrome c-type biogenesis protein CcmE
MAKRKESRWWLKLTLMVGVPLLFLLALEFLLSVSGYGEDLSLFIPLTEKSTLLRANPLYAGHNEFYGALEARSAHFL